MVQKAIKKKHSRRLRFIPGRVNVHGSRLKNRNGDIFDAAVEKTIHPRHALLLILLVFLLLRMIPPSPGSLCSFDLGRRVGATCREKTSEFNPVAEEKCKEREDEKEQDQRRSLDGGGSIGGESKLRLFHIGKQSAGKKLGRGEGFQCRTRKLF